MESTATASSSSNDGARNKSRMLRCLFLRASDKDDPLPSAPSELFAPIILCCTGGFDAVTGSGRTIGNVFQ